MAPATLRKDAAWTGMVPLLVLGLMMPSVFVSGQATTAVPTNTAATQSPSSTMQTMAATTQSPSSTMQTMAATTQPPTMTMQTMAATAQTPTSTMQTMAATTQTPTSTMQTRAATAQTPTTTAGAMTQPASTATTAAGMMTPMTTSTTASGPTSPSSMTSMMTTMMSAGMSNGTSNGTSNGMLMSNTSMNMIYCPAFMCNYSDCYSMYMNTSATPCADDCYCQMLRQTDVCYVASCVASCAESCGNSTSRTNCSVGCCNSTGCLNETFAGMMSMATTTVMSTTTTRSTTTSTTTVTVPTTVDNRNKCNQGQCQGATCYTTFANTLQSCSSTDNHCQLKKESVNGGTQWTAGCTTNCSAQTTCKANVQPPCHLECCNATMTSCLFLNGTLNVLSFATRGPHLHAEVMASLLCLLAMGFLL